MKAHALPEGWSIKALGDPSVAIINPPEKLPKADAYPFIPMDAVADRFGGVKYIETIKEASGGYTRFRDGDILFAKITPCVENGKVARISGLNGLLGLGSTEFHAIRPAENTDGDYLYYLMSSGAVHGLAVSLMEGTTGRQRIPASIFKRRLAVPVPLDKQEQRRIAAVLSKVDETIAKTQASIAAAQKLKRALMQNLLTGKLKPNGTWRRDDEFDIDLKIGRVPKGWDASKLKNLGKFSNGANFSADAVGSGYPFVNLMDVFASPQIDTTKLDRVDVKATEQLRLEAGDLLFVRSSVKLDGIGQPSVFPGSDEPVIFCGFLIRFSFDQARIRPYYLCAMLHTEEMRNRTIAFGQVGANTNISQRALGGLAVVFPKSLSEQDSIMESLHSVDVLIEKKNNKLMRLSRLKKSLMQNLLTGKVRVPPDLKIE